MFRCGDVIPDCDEEIRGSEAEILQLVAKHAAEAHGMDPLPGALVSVIADKITTVNG
ncbi:MAG: DUF1059 domain-containing protein [Microlunatus sp.]|nr:DUF1059 domain-containing protein [Microlunatus sp.]